MPDSPKPRKGAALFRTAGRCSFAGVVVSLILTLGSFWVICALLFQTTPGFIPDAWPYEWAAELFFLWCIPFFLTIWQLTKAVLEEYYGYGMETRDYLDKYAR